jgi:AbiV family abortive infection protein
MTSQEENKKGRPTEYRGPLTAEQVAAGMSAAVRNARRLASDARILIDAKRYASAAALAALSIEESGKSSILRELAVADKPEVIKKGWQTYRDHRSKNGFWILPDLVRAGARKFDDLREVVERSGEHTALLNSLKQIGLYTDCYGSAHWSEPDKVFEGKEVDLAVYLVEVAELLSRSQKEITPREIELWVEHMKPVWLTAEMRYGLLRFAEAMQREGLSTSTPEEYARFVFGEPEASAWKAKSPAKQ